MFTDLGSMASDIKRALEACQSELNDTKERNTLLEKECVIYKSQLEVLYHSSRELGTKNVCISLLFLPLQDLHRKLDVERQDRRVSDSKALQLLAEIRDQSKMAQDLRESQNKLVQSLFGIDGHFSINLYTYIPYNHSFSKYK